MEDDLDYKNIVISPHLDDAVFSLGGLLAKESEKTKIITIFSGIPTKPLVRIWDKSCGFKNSTVAMEERIKENSFALYSLGIKEKNIINLNYLDKQYRNSFLTKPKYPIQEIIQSISKELKKIIEIEKDKKLKIFIPMSSIHQDHKIVRDIIIQLYKDERKKIDLYLYQDMPYFYSEYLSKRFYKIFNSKEKILKEIKIKDLICKQELVELTNEEFSKKQIASKLYKSQFNTKFSSIHSLTRKQYFISKKQVDIFKIKKPHCEVIYKIL